MGGEEGPAYTTRYTTAVSPGYMKKGSAGRKR